MTPRIIRDLPKWREIRRKMQGKAIGFVPTMGNLHAGHVSLLRRSLAENDITVISCFVNPTQFNNQNDFENYPSTLEKDVSICNDLGVDYFLMPEKNAIYPDNFRYRVSEHELSSIMEGSYRPGHFEGMLTVVLKLLTLVRADRAYFGEKDFQQLQLVKGLVEAFFIDTEIVACPIVRDEFGLALSSRNSRLSEAELKIARNLNKFLKSSLDTQQITEKLESCGFSVDYVEEHLQRRFAAASIGGVRLIDNMEIE